MRREGTFRGDLEAELNRQLGLEEQVQHERGTEQPAVEMAQAAVETVAAEEWVDEGEFYGRELPPVTEEAPFSMIDVSPEEYRRARTQWNLQVNQVEMGTHDQSKPLRFGKTPLVLRAVGADDLPLVMDAGVVAKAQEKHGLTLDSLRQVFDELHAPLAVFQSERISDAQVVLTALEQDGEPVVAAVHLNRVQQRHEVNKIESVYPKNTEALRRWIEAGDLRFLSQEKTLPSALSRGLQLPKEATSRKGKNNILTERDVVKLANEKKPGGESSFSLIGIPQFSRDFLDAWEGGALKGEGLLEAAPWAVSSEQEFQTRFYRFVVDRYNRDGRLGVPEVDEQLAAALAGAKAKAKLVSNERRKTLGIEFAGERKLTPEEKARFMGWLDFAEQQAQQEARRLKEARDGLAALRDGLKTFGDRLKSGHPAGGYDLAGFRQAVRDFDPKRRGGVGFSMVPVNPAQDARYLDLARDPEANREELQRMVDRAQPASTPWPDSFPNVLQMSTAAAVIRHPDHQAAKSGDREAAARLVADVSKPAKLTALAARHPGAIIVPVHAEEASGRNQIPAKFADFVGHVTGLEVDETILQANKVGRTGGGAWHRMAFRPKFDGPIKPGGDYILVDDIVTGGGSLSELRRHIESRGGRVVEMVTLGAAQFSAKIALSDKTRLALESGLGVDSLREFLQAEHLYGGEHRALTEAEARTLLRAGSVDAARTRILEAGQDFLRATQPGVFPETLSPSETQVRIARGIPAPVAYDAAGNVIPLSQRFNLPSSQDGGNFSLIAQKARDNRTPLTRVDILRDGDRVVYDGQPWTFRENQKGARRQVWRAGWNDRTARMDEYTADQNERLITLEGPTGRKDIWTSADRYLPLLSRAAAPVTPVTEERRLRAFRSGGALTVSALPEQSLFSLIPGSPEEAATHNALERLRQEGRVRDDGTVLAPNGQDSILFRTLLDEIGDRAEAERRYALVHTPRFKRWFGDWLGLAPRKEPTAPEDELLSPTGHLDWSAFTDWDAEQSKGAIQPGPIRVLKGRHEGPNRGFGMEHIEAEHAEEFRARGISASDFVHRTLLNFNEVYLDGARLVLFSTRPTALAVVELRREKGGYYSVVTAFEKENPSWKPRGERIVGGRRAALAQSANAPGRAAQGSVKPKPPLEPLPGNDSILSLRYLSEPVNPESVSKVVDANGEPLVVWHGTNAEFDAFDPASVGANLGYDTEGFFFARLKSDAQAYANDAARREGGAARTIPVFLNLKSPYTYADHADEYGDAPTPEAGMDGRLLIDWADIYRRDHLRTAKETGKDGISIERGNDGLYTAFGSTQIKHATGNDGTFDRDDGGFNSSMIPYYGPSEHDALLAALFDPFQRSETLRVRLAAEMDRRLEGIKAQVADLNRERLPYDAIEAERKQREQDLYWQKIEALGSNWNSALSAPPASLLEDPLIDNLVTRRGGKLRGELESRSAYQRRTGKRPGAEYAQG